MCQSGGCDEGVEGPRRSACVRPTAAGSDATKGPGGIGSIGADRSRPRPPEGGPGVVRAHALWRQAGAEGELGEGDGGDHGLLGKHLGSPEPTEHDERGRSRMPARGLSSPQPTVQHSVDIRMQSRGRRREGVDSGQAVPPRSGPVPYRSKLDHRLPRLAGRHGLATLHRVPSRPRRPGYASTRISPDPRVACLTRETPSRPRAYPAGGHPRAERSGGGPLPFGRAGDVDELDRPQLAGPEPAPRRQQVRAGGDGQDEPGTRIGVEIENRPHRGHSGRSPSRSGGSFRR